MNLQESYQTSFELIDSVATLDHDSSWELCNKELRLLGINSVFYGFHTSKTEIERRGMTKSCFYRTNHSPKWLEAVGADTFLDSDVTASLIMGDEKEVIWSDESTWDSANAEEREQAHVENDVGMGVGVTLQLSSLNDGVGAGVGLCTADISAKEFASYWQQNRLKAHAICQVMDMSLRTSHTAAFLGLTPREIEFLQYLAAGYTLKEMACKWNRALTTLNSHSRSCREKLNSSSLEQAVFKAFALGLISP